VLVWLGKDKKMVMITKEKLFIMEYGESEGTGCDNTHGERRKR